MFFITSFFPEIFFNVCFFPDCTQQKYFSEDESEEGADEDIEVEAEVEEKDPVAGRRDELAGVHLLAARFSTKENSRQLEPKFSTSGQRNDDERPIKPSPEYISDQR